MAVWVDEQSERERIRRQRYYESVRDSYAAQDPAVLDEQSDLISSYLEAAPQLRVVPSLLLSFAENKVTTADADFTAITKVLSPDRVAQMQTRYGTETDEFYKGLENALIFSSLEDNPLTGTIDGDQTGWFDSPTGFFRKATRTGFTAIGYPIEAGLNALQGVSNAQLRIGPQSTPDPLGMRERARNRTPEPSETGLGDMLWRGTHLGASTSGKDLGSGWFPGGDAAREAQRYAGRALGTDKNGVAWTPGRFTAASFADEDSIKYDLLGAGIDIATTWRVDPAALALSGAGRVIRARKTFDAGQTAIERNLISAAAEARGLTVQDALLEPGVRDAALAAAGARRGIAKAVHGPSALEFLASEKGKNMAQVLAAETNGRRIYNWFKGQMPIEVAQTVAKISDEDGIAAFMADLLGVTVDRVPKSRALLKMGPGGYRVHRPFENVRWLNTVPGRVLDLEDHDQTWQQLDRFLVNAKAGSEARDEIFELMADARRPPHVYRAASTAMDRAAETLMGQYNIAPHQAREVTRLFRNETDAAGRYFINEAGTPVTYSAMVGGERVTVNGPHLWSEGLRRTLTLPDPREIRAHASMWGNYMKRVGVDNAFVTGIAGLDFVFNKVWKPAQILRVATTIRVVGEEQLRMAVVGMNSAFNHPMTWIASVIADPDMSRIGRYGPIRQAAATALHGVATGFDDYDNWLARAFGDSKMYNRLRDKAFSNDLFAEAFSQQLLDDGSAISKTVTGAMGRHQDPTKVALKGLRLFNRNDKDFAEAWAWELDQLATDPVSRVVARAINEGHSLDGIVASFTGGELAKIRQDMMRFSDDHARLLATDEGRRAYIASVEQRVMVKTAGDADLIAAVARRKVDDDLLAMLTRHADDGFGPTEVKGPAILRGELRGVGKVAQAYDAAVDRAFSLLYSSPTNKLSRQPAFAQAYWNHAEDMFPYAMREVQDAMIANAPRDVRTRLNVLRGRHGGGDLPAHVVDAHAKIKALDDVKWLLYDITERGQASDILRFIFPFGEAWKEVMTRWATLMKEQPQVFARTATLEREFERQDDLFVKDPNTGELMMPIPGSQFVNEMTAGVPIPLTARVSGLNIVAQGMPGFGPAAQIAAASIIPETAGTKWLRDMISPYGEVDTEGGWFESLFPNWSQKLRTAGVGGIVGIGRSETQQRTYEHLVREVAAYLVSTGEYDLEDQDEWNRWHADARTKAKTLLLVAGGAQFTFPSAPKMNAVYEDARDGRLFMIAELQQEYDRQLEADPRSAVKNMIAQFGPDVVYAISPRSYPRVYGLSVTKEMGKWAANNKGVIDDYPLVYPLLFDRKAKDDDSYDPGEFTRQLETGARREFDGTKGGFDDWAKLAQHRIGQVFYDTYRARYGDTLTATQAAWFRDVLEPEIRKHYPGWDTNVADSVRLSYDGGDWDNAIGQMRRAVTDPRTKDSRAVKAIGIYLNYRDQALAAAKEAGLASFTDAKAAEGLRDWLRQAASAIITEYPEFSPTWDLFFSREGKLNDDDEVEP